MSILGWIVFGFIVGLIARAIMPGKDALGLIGTTALGVVGALLAGWIGQASGWYQADEGAGFISATIGAVVVLAIYYAITGRRRRRLGSTTGSRDQDRRVA
ncbi:MAG: hypothetical protein A2X94_07140 [Bdellovibrionales bacterium GWB1_55_8]|nr:MAG: hypothetical protein A2X94_07140 [Bdellovibrionales bacterium GWB1_55_8]